MIRAHRGGEYEGRVVELTVEAEMPARQIKCVPMEQAQGLHVIATDVRVEGEAAEGAGAVALGQATRVDDQRPAHNAIRNE